MHPRKRIVYFPFKKSTGHFFSWEAKISWIFFAQGVVACMKTLLRHPISKLILAEDAVFLKINKFMFSTQTDILAAFVYVAPKRSPIYNDDNPDAIEKLEHYIIQISMKFTLESMR